MDPLERVQEAIAIVKAVRDDQLDDLERRGVSTVGDEDLEDKVALALCIGVLNALDELAEALRPEETG